MATLDSSGPAPTALPIAIIFANLKGNVGDFAILHGMLVDLSLRYPGVPVDVYSHPMHTIDNRRLALFEAAAPPPFTLRGATPKYQFGVLDRLMYRFGFLKAGRQRLIERFARNASASMGGFQRYSAVFFAGGDQWSGRELGLHMFGTLRALNMLGVPTYAYPFSVKASIAVTYPEGGIRDLFHGLAEPIVVRDTMSGTLLHEFGVPARTAVDSVFALSDVAASVPVATGRAADRVLLVCKGDAGALAEATSRLVAAGIPVALLTTAEPEDRKSYEPVASSLGLEIIAPTTWQEIVSEMKASSLVITNRLHGLILGTLADTAVMPITARAKARAYAEDVGIDHVAPATSSISADLVRAALRDRAFTIGKMRSYREAARSDLRRAMTPEM